MMKRWNVYGLAALAALALAACSPTKVDPEKMQDTAAVQVTPGETESAGNAEDKVPDPTEPIVDVVSIYSVEGDDLAESIDEVAELSAEALVSKLEEYGVLPEGTIVLSYEEEGEGAGPGVAEGQGAKKAVLNLSQGVADEGKKDLGVQAVTNTFVENMALDEFTLLVNGAEY